MKIYTFTDWYSGNTAVFTSEANRNNFMMQYIAANTDDDGAPIYGEDYTIETLEADPNFHEWWGE